MYTVDTTLTLFKISKALQRKCCSMDISRYMVSICPLPLLSLFFPRLLEFSLCLYIFTLSLSDVYICACSLTLSLSAAPCHWCCSARNQLLPPTSDYPSFLWLTTTACCFNSISNHSNCCHYSNLERKKPYDP